MDMNMDVKDLFAKLKKDKGEKKVGGGLTGFFEKNPKMKIIIPVVLIAISVIVALIIIFTTGKNDVKDVDSNNFENQQQVQVLPQDVIEHESYENGDDVFDEVEIANAKITMIMNNSDGYYTACMVTDHNTFPHLQVGDHINGSSWLVENITDDTVTVSSNDKKIELKLSK